MRKNLVARGNGWLLTTNKCLIKLIGLDPEKSELQFKIKNKILYIRGIEPDDPEYGKSLIRKFSRKNTSWGLYLPNSILELLEINPEKDEINIEVDDNILIIKKG